MGGLEVGLEGDGNGLECTGERFGWSDGRWRYDPGIKGEPLGYKEQLRERNEGPEPGGKYIAEGA